jgi:hypothetical protein
MANLFLWREYIIGKYISIVIWCEGKYDIL